MRILDVLTSPWAITPEKLCEIQAIYYTHLRGEKIRKEEIMALVEKREAKEPARYEVEGGVAIIPIEGVLAQKMNLFAAISGGTSTQLIERDFKAAMDDPAVKSILLYVDSPGGEVSGVQELAQVIEGGRGKKPLVAFTDGIMASGAYWIGAAADLIYISSDTAQVGSIGVVATHIDTSKAEEMRGVKTTEIYAGKYKRIASKTGPLSEEGRATIQEMVDQLYGIFAGDVSRLRGLEIPEEGGIPWADGRVYMGRKGIQAGLVDGVSSFSDLKDRLRSEPGFVKREIVTQKVRRKNDGR